MRHFVWWKCRSVFSAHHFIWVQSLLWMILLINKLFMHVTGSDVQQQQVQSVFTVCRVTRCPVNTSLSGSTRFVFFLMRWTCSKQTPTMHPANAFCLEAGELFPRNMSLTPILIHLWLHMHAVASLPSSIIAGPNAGRGPSLSGNALDLEREMNTEKGVAYISCAV